MSLERRVRRDEGVDEPFGLEPEAEERVEVGSAVGAAPTWTCRRGIMIGTRAEHAESESSARDRARPASSEHSVARGTA